MPSYGVPGPSQPSFHAAGMEPGASLSAGGSTHGLPSEDNCCCPLLSLPWPWGTVVGAQSHCLLPSQVRQNLVLRLAMLLILLQIITITEHWCSHAGSETVIAARCQPAKGSSRPRWHLRSFHPSELLTKDCVLRSLEFRDFLKTALDKNPETRPSAAQLLEVGTGTSPWAGSAAGGWVCGCPNHLHGSP